MASKVNKENYVVIQGWMLTDLQLKGNELLVYACIYGFSQHENQVFNGSWQYLADWTNSTKRGISNSLKSLVEKGYVEKADKFINGVKFCEYRAKNFTRAENNFHGGGEKSSSPSDEKSSPNNLDIDNLDNKQEYKKFTKPTIEEVQAYCRERNNNVDVQKWYDHYSSNGWKVGRSKMVDWKAAVRTWERSGDNGKRKQVNFEPYPDEY